MEWGLVHRFADPSPLDDTRARRWLGGKGASLAQMTRMGLPVPPGFTLSTEVWRRFDAEGRLSEELLARLKDELTHLEGETSLTLGDARTPLLLAVRSGAPSSMPGMLDTVLDVGVQGDIARGLAEKYGAERFGLDVRRRFLESYGCVVLGVPREAFDAVLARRDPRQMEADALAGLLDEYERMIRHESGEAVPDDPWTQLVTSIEGVLRSWRSTRAQQYREAHGIDEDEGTGVTVQAMVFGNLGERSGAGVVFSRNPSTGERAPWGEWLPRSQGEDVVSGRRTPQPLTSAQVRRGMRDESLEAAMPETLAELREILTRLESRYGDAQDVELTIERGRLFMLQCRAAKRTARAAARIAVEMVEEGLLQREEALARVEPASLRQLLTPRLPDPQALASAGIAPIARGLAASPGAAVGRIALDAEAAASLGAGEDLILVRAETSAEDVDTMRAVAGVLTAAGGLTSHAAVVARAMGKPCVAGATSLHVDYGRRLVTSRSDKGDAVELREGETLTIDGARGLVYAAAVPVEPAPASAHVETVLAWADAVRGAEVLAEAHSERLARVGVSFGADGVLAGEGADAGAIVRAAGALPVWMMAAREEDARAALAALRPGLDVLVTDAWRALSAEAAARGVRLGSVARRGAALETLDACVLDVPDADAVAGLADPLPGAVLLRGEAATDTAVLRALAGRALAVAVPPLDVPGARVCAGRAASSGG